MRNMSDETRLTHNERAVLEVLVRERRPLGAYDLLDALRPAGVKAPPTVYRALGRLVTAGLAHRIESLNAYVACGEPGHSGPVALAICRACGQTAELDEAALIGDLRRRAAEAGFEVETAMIELRGLCRGCRATPLASETPS
jgi:Fur family zinc uptake transcriptional regulator